MSSPLSVVIYYRVRPSEAEASAAALDAQRHAVASWIEQHSPHVLAEFVEEERDTNNRPALGKAIALCRRQDARLIVARTIPIGTGRAFGSINDTWISGVRCERLVNPIGIVIYLRSRPSESDASALSLTAQREGVETWRAKRPTFVIVEYLEIEEEDEGRPILVQAISACSLAASGATLLIGTLADIGTGLPMPKPSAKVPVEIAWSPPPKRPDTPRPQDIALPAGAPPGISFVFVPTDPQRLAVYLCNPTSKPLSRLTVSSVGETTHGPSGHDGSSEGIATSVSRKDLGDLPPGLCRHVENYNVLWDGDFVTSYQVTHVTRDGSAHTRGAVIGTGGRIGLS